MQASDICKKPILNEADSCQKHVMDSVRGLRAGIHPKTKIELTSHTLHGLLCAAALAMVLVKMKQLLSYYNLCRQRKILLRSDVTRRRKMSIRYNTQKANRKFYTYIQDPRSTIHAM